MMEKKLMAGQQNQYVRLFIKSTLAAKEMFRRIASEVLS